MHNVLIADDSATARMVIKRCFEVIGCRENWSFQEAVNGKDALEKLRQNSFDLLLTDINMPVMDGKKLLLGVKSSPRLNHIPVVVISSLGNPALIDELKRIGANIVIHKPISPEKIIQAIEEIFGKDALP
jgi:two-component system chemotaxis response regulator CheY